ncbi:hypothetical protein PENTCL1PPCAC_6773, partial [Pristionchus entomophagus]
GSKPGRSSTMRLIGLTSLILLSCLVYASLPPDPYTVLGLKKGANIKDVKKAYKSLVREWHPDKNDSPQAAERFMEISKAYELLNDPLKKERYDKFGTVDDEPRGGGGNPFGFDPFFGGFGFGGFDNGNSFFAKHRVGIRHYTNTILEKSHSQPFIIFAYSGYCRTCFAMESIWQSVVEDLEPLGYGIATVNAMTDSNLLERMRVSRLPTILVLLEGRTVHYRSSPQYTTAKSLRLFARDVIPDSYIIKISTHDKLKRFLDQAKSTNKVSVVILGSAPEPRLRYLLSAMRRSDTARFTYVHLGDTTHEMDEMKEAMSIKCTQCENVLVFNEFPENGPIGRLSMSKASDLSKNTLNSLLDQHRFLLLPRISSPSYLDALCPLSSRSSRVLCVWLVATSSSDSCIDSFRSFMVRKGKEISAKNMRVSYISATTQSDFLRPFMDSRSSEVENSSRDIVMVWRSESQRGRFSWFEGAWNTDKPLESGEILMKKMEGVVEGRIKLEKGIVFGNMNDEYVPSLFSRISKRIVRFIEHAWFELSKEEVYPVISAVFAFLLIMMIGYGASAAMRAEKGGGHRPCPPFNGRRTPSTDSAWHPEDPKMNREEGEGEEGENLTQMETAEMVQRRRLKRAHSVMSPHLHELRAESYFGMIRLLKPGCRSIVILVDAEHKETLLEHFALCIYPLRNNKTFSFGYVMVEKNLAFFRKLLEHTLPASEDKGPPSMYERLKGINPKQTVGTVLVMCGWKLYFCIYHPMHIASGKKNFLGFDDDGETEDELSDESGDDVEREGKTTSRRHFRPSVSNVLNGFPNWLDRLLEGSIRRYYIPEWPDNLH